MKPLTPAQLASDAIDLFVEYQERHGYDPEQARLAAVAEVAEGAAVTDDAITEEETEMSEHVEMQPVTVEDVEELLGSRGMEPTLIRWLDTGAIEVVAGVLFSDISYSERRRPHEVITTKADLESAGDWDPANPTRDDYEAFAQLLTEGW